MDRVVLMPRIQQREGVSPEGRTVRSLKFLFFGQGLLACGGTASRMAIKFLLLLFFPSFSPPFPEGPTDQKEGGMKLRDCVRQRGQKYGRILTVPQLRGVSSRATSHSMP